MNFALLFYPLLGWDSLVFSYVWDIIALPVVITVLLVWFGWLARYIMFARVIYVLCSAAILILTAFIFLNGALDEHPPVEADALVSTKYVTRGRFAGPVLDLSIEWNQRRSEETLAVSRETFSAVEPGDSVSVVVHPGAFSIPWYGNVVVVNGTAR